VQKVISSEDKIVKIMSKKDRTIEASKCIYCHKNNGNSREHIIPDAILARIPNNAWIIHKGSCSICQKTINKFETDVLNNMFKGIRPALGMKKGEVEVFNIDGNSICSPHAYLCIDILFGLPGFITNLNVTDGSIKIRETSQLIYDPLNLINQYSPNLQSDQLIAEISLSPLCYARFLAKIAYGFFVFHIDGIQNVSDIISNQILNPNEISNFVGSLNSNERHSFEERCTLIDSFKTKHHIVCLYKFSNSIVAIINLFNQNHNSGFHHIVKIS